MDTLSWQGNSSGTFSLKVGWNLLRTIAAKVIWARLIQNKFVFPHLACFIWRLLHSKTPTDAWVKHKGMYLASRCYSYFSSKETNLHMFFSCNLAHHFWSWLLSLFGCSSSFPLSPTYIWTTMLMMEMLLEENAQLPSSSMPSLFFGFSRMTPSI